ncbi:hypothetical protein RHGRI_006517 [Rhododendron griersonianum]|uniref:Secreted protein n=1 Tax=Rhododendron griersonianum TaxID=479676 RepID=A0AAV6KTY3_9ERIC|nr:hypothetical protein RHGRI_006517 [Rhododendron griersonianum]
MANWLGFCGCAATTLGYTAWPLQHIARERVQYTTVNIVGYKYMDGTIRHTSVKLFASNTPMFPSQKEV